MASCCCSECFRGVKNLQCETQSCMVSVSKKGPLWMKCFICALNIFVTPFCLVFHYLRIYIFPCLFFSCCRVDVLAFCCPRWLFVDKVFKADQTGLGEIGATASNVGWKRLKPESKQAGAKMKLFEGKIEAKDVCQGALGDCWLLSAIACMTEFQGGISMLFYSHRHNPRGKYYCELFDVQEQKWVMIVVDDLFPHDERTGKLLFTQPNNDELWVLVLEKAFAKFCGSYHAIEGGLLVWAFQAMTGDAVSHYSQSADHTSWERLEMKPKPDVSNKRQCGLYKTRDELLDDAMFKMVIKFKGAGCVMGAGSRGQDDTIAEGRTKTGGIVPGHAYSVVAAVQIGDLQLIQLRNPWGTFEWDGDWSDTSPLWATHTHVARKCHFSPDAPDDGLFWMTWTDFAKHFSSVDVCFRTQGMRELQLHVEEDCAPCGPCVGALYGTGKFWCMCQGLYKLWCVRRGSEEELESFQSHHLNENDMANKSDTV